MGALRGLVQREVSQVIVIVFGIIAGIAVILAILMLLWICAIYSPEVSYSAEMIILNQQYMIKYLHLDEI